MSLFKKLKECLFKRKNKRVGRFYAYKKFGDKHPCAIENTIDELIQKCNEIGVENPIIAKELDCEVNFFSFVS